MVKILQGGFVKEYYKKRGGFGCFRGGRAVLANFAVNNNSFFMIIFSRLAIVIVACFMPLSLLAQGIASSDPQTMDWVKRQVAAGSSQKEIQDELLKQGMDPDQITELMTTLRTEGQRDQRQRTAYPIEELDEELLTPELTEELSQLPDSVPSNQSMHPEEQIFGQSLFNNRRMSFEPNDRIPAPVSYRLGPNDRVQVTIHGENQSQLIDRLTPEGCLFVPSYGLVPLSGLTVAEAERTLADALSTIYGGIAEGRTGVSLTVYGGRPIRVHVMGEVVTPGTYTLSPYASLFHAIYRAGGLSDLAGLRAIELVRGGQTVGVLDAYAYIFKGVLPEVTALQDGDVVIVPTYGRLVKVTGAVKRPMFYEMTATESLDELLRYAGGLSAKAYRKSFSIERQEDDGVRICSVTSDQAKGFILEDGDVLTVREADERFTNRLEIRGAVYHPGFFQLSPEIQTIKQLVEAADGLRPDAFTGRSVLYRRRTDETREAQAIAIEAEVQGSATTLLRNNDLLFIPSVQDIREQAEVEIFGEVSKPGSYAYLENQTLEDLVLQAGGLKESASMVRVDVTRRINNGTADNDSISRMFSFGLKEGLVVDGQPGFVLQPYDQVFVRSNPGYKVQENVTVEGEVLYEGVYSLTSRNERLADLVRKAGGLNTHAYAGGARLVRKANETEIKQMEQVIQLINKELGAQVTDSLQLAVDTLISVGIDLEQALINPAGDDNIVLREGDKLFIPTVDNTVKIDGGVMFPNTVAFEKGMRVKDYINQAGGFSASARKSGVFVVYMSGKVAKVSARSRKEVRPGCRIIVPLKNKRGNLASTLSALTSISSIGMMVATMANVIKK